MMTSSKDLSECTQVSRVHSERSLLLNVSIFSNFTYTGVYLYRNIDLILEFVRTRLESIKSPLPQLHMYFIGLHTQTRTHSHIQALKPFLFFNSELVQHHNASEMLGGDSSKKCSSPPPFIWRSQGKGFSSQDFASISFFSFTSSTFVVLSILLFHSPDQNLSSS